MEVPLCIVLLPHHLCPSCHCEHGHLSDPFYSHWLHKGALQKVAAFISHTSIVLGKCDGSCEKCTN